MKPFILALAVLLLAAASLFLWKLGDTPFIDYDEAIYAQVIQSTEEAGSSATLYHSGSPWFEKPPLYFWLARVSEATSSTPEFAWRLPAALAGILSVLLTVLIAHAITGSARAGIFAGSALLLTGFYLEAGRQLRLDVVVTCFLLLAFYAFIRGRKDPRWYLLLGPAIALGVLTKSVIGFFVLVPITAWAFLHGDWGWLRSRFLWIGAGFGMLILIPWHVIETISFGREFWDNYLFHHVLGRFGENVLGGTSSNEPYLIHGTLFGFPWTLLWLLGGIGSVLALFVKRDGRPVLRALTALFLGTAILCLIYGAAQTKLLYYLIPVYPFIALFCGIFLARVYEWRSGRGERIGMGIGIAILYALAAWNTWHVGYAHHPKLAISQNLAVEERAIGVHLQGEANEWPVYAYRFLYWDAIRYYSGKSVTAIGENTPLTEPVYIVLQVEYLPFVLTPSTAPHMTLAYEGKLLSLIRFVP